MEPEIARRCLECGASVRGTAFYCPECGKPLHAGAAKVESEAEAVVMPVHVTEVAEGETPSEVDAPAPAEAEEVSMRHRVTVAAREAVEGKIGPRVEKLRHASNAMFEEATDDPSLRFVLVALALFLLSLLLLFLNHLLG